MSRDWLLCLRACVLLMLLGQASCTPSRLSRPVHAAPSTVLDAEVSGLLRKYHVASVSVALIEQGRVVFERAYGQQSEGVPATPETLFNLASLTKPVVAEVLLRLVAGGELSLDEPLSAHWIDPEVAADARHQQLTLRIALSHQTGLPNWRGHRPDGKLGFAFTPGTQFNYSGEGYAYAARFAEKKLGRGFEDLAQQAVFGPARMTRTSFSWREWMQGRLAVPLDAQGRWGAPQVESAGQWNAANNLMTTAGDYARFMAGVMRGAGLNSQMAEERWQPARGPQPEWVCRVEAVEACPQSSRIVFGWNRLDFADGPLFMHTGSNRRPGGERTLAYFDPRRQRGVVILTSGEEGERLYRDIAVRLDAGSRMAAYLAAH